MTTGPLTTRQQHHRSVVSGQWSRGLVVSWSLCRSLWCPLLLLYFVTMGGTFWGSLNGSVKILNQCLTLLLTITLITQYAIRNTQYAIRFTFHILFALCGLLSAWQSTYPRLAIEGGFQQLWYLLLFFLALAYVRRSNDIGSTSRRDDTQPDAPGGATYKNVATLVSGLLIATSVLALWGAGQYLAWWFDPQRDVSAGGQRVIRATLNSHNDFAGYMALLLPLSLFASLDTNNNRWRVFIHRTRTLLMLFCIVLTYSRAGWLGAMVAVVSYSALAVYRRRQQGNDRERQGTTGNDRKQQDTTGKYVSSFPVISRRSLLFPVVPCRFLLCCLAVVVIAFIFSPQRVAVQRITGAISQPTADMGVSGRRIIWRNSLAMIAQRPLWGGGAHTFPLIYPQFVRQNEQRELTFHAHNLILQYAAEAGIAAALLFVFIIAVTLKQAWSKTAPPHPLKIPLTAGIVAYLAYSLFNCCEAIPAIHGTFWVMMGMLAGISDQESMGQWVNGSMGQRQLVIGHWSLIIAVLLFAAPFVLKTDLAQLQFESAANGKPAVSALQKAVDMDPYNAFYHGQLALTLSVDNKRLHEAIAHYRRALELCPYDALYRHNLGWCYVRLKQYDTAITHFQNAITYDKSQPLYYLSLGCVLEQKGCDDEALRHYETASHLWANAPISDVLKARVLARQGKRKEASAAYQSALDAVRSGRAASGCHIPVRYRRIGFADEVIQPKEWSISEKDVMNEWDLFRRQR